MDITYDYYRIFYYVAKYGSFSRAAQVLLRGQPNITKTINNLENQLGCKLFLRSSRGVSLTSEGEKLFRHAEIAFENLSKAENEIISERMLDGGLISIAATEIGLYGVLLPALTEFHRDFPKVKIRLSSLNSPQALNAVKNGIADFAVITLHKKTDSIFNIRALKNFTEPLCCRKGYTTGFSGNLFELPYISMNRSSDTYEFYKEYLQSCGIEKEPDFEVAAADQVLPLVKAGVGIGFVSRFLADEDLKCGIIEELKLPYPVKSRSICLVQIKNHSLSLVANKLTEYIVKQAKNK